ncbi:MAG: tetratricopeptide repeat protein [Candidatus Omnitrophota bacterium]
MNKINTILLLQIASIIILSFFIYATSLNGKFLWDDEFLVQDNVYIKHFSMIPGIFTKTIGVGAGRESPCYRPLQMLTYMFDYSLWGLNAVGYHLTNIILHTIAALMLFWLVYLLYNRQLLSFLVSILFVSHPIHVEAVAYISGRAESLATIGIILCLICYIKQISLNKKMIFTLMILSFCAAILSKESSLIVPILILLYSYVFKKKILKKEFIYIVVTALLYLIFRGLIIKNTQIIGIPSVTIFQRIPGFFVAITRYLQLLFLPFNLHMEYGNKLFLFSEFRAIAGVVILFLLFGYAFKKRKDDKLKTFSVYWFFITLLPVSNLYSINAYMAEHWLYLPSLGFFLIIAHRLSSLYVIKKTKLLSIFLILFILSGYSYLSLSQNAYWREPVAFYTKTISYAPNSVRLYLNLAKTYESAGNYKEAIGILEKAIEIDSKNSHTFNLLGTAYSAMGNRERAVIAYKKALSIDPNHADAYYNLGNEYIAIGDTEKAILSFKKAIEIAPKNIHAVSYYNNLASVYAADGKISEAIEAYKKASEIDPNNIILQQNIKILNSAIPNNKKR